MGEDEALEKAKERAEKRLAEMKEHQEKIDRVRVEAALQRALARQAEAERERRAKVINAEGEFQAAQRLAEASEIIEKHPVALQLRYLQTLSEVATENNSTTLFPIPIDLLRPFLRGASGAASDSSTT